MYETTFVTVPKFTLYLLVIAQAQTMDFEAYDPPSTLVVPENDLRRAKFPFIDVHNHQWQMETQDLVALAADMDSLNMAVMVNLSGRGFPELPVMMENPVLLCKSLSIANSIAACSCRCTG